MPYSSYMLPNFVYENLRPVGEVASKAAGVSFF
jgi:hypothetical protein